MKRVVNILTASALLAFTACSKNDNVGYGMLHIGLNTDGFVVETTKATVLSEPKVDLLIPTGTAIENARTSHIGLLTRDCYHLSMDKGRYIAALTLISALSDIDAAEAKWAPNGVDEYAKKVAVESVRNAQKAPLDITQSEL